MVNSNYDYSKLLGRMKEKGIIQSALAKVIGMSENSINLKLNNKSFFKQGEIIAICAVLDIPLDDVESYFFSHKSLEI